MSRLFRIILFCLGLGCIIAAMVLFFSSQEEEQVAESSSRAILGEFVMQLEHEIGLQYQENAEESPLSALLPGGAESAESEPPETPNIAATEDPVVAIDGNYYMGVLSIPKFSLSLPVVTVCNYANLRNTPCAYTGSLATQNLTIVAHNYSSHFGSLPRLERGDEVTILDAKGILHTYRMIAKETLEQHDVESCTTGDWDLTLFTCVYGKNTHRVVVRFEEITE